jgi:hypothetical protein
MKFKLNFEMSNGARGSLSIVCFVFALAAPGGREWGIFFPFDLGRSSKFFQPKYFKNKVTGLDIARNLLIPSDYVCF